MQYLMFFLISIATFSAQAIHFQITDQNGQSLFKTQWSVQTPTNIGDVTIEIFNKFQIPFSGSKYGISQINGKGQDIEVISDNEMKAYGWCFEVDGLIPETMPDQTALESNSVEIEWFYAYAHYKDGNWIGQCVRSNSQSNQVNFLF